MTKIGVRQIKESGWEGISEMREARRAARIRKSTWCWESDTVGNEGTLQILSASPLFNRPSIILLLSGGKVKDNRYSKTQQEKVL